MEVIAIRDCSAGNDTVGEMWKETKIFDSSEPIQKILEWAFSDQYEYSTRKLKDGFPSRKNLTITVPDTR